MYTQIAVAALLISAAAAYSSGAPDETCSSRTPNHGVVAQTGTCPYDIVALGWIAGEYTSMGIFPTQEGSLNYFEGFLASVFYNGEPIGQMKPGRRQDNIPPTASVKTTCQRTSLTHTNDEHKTEIFFEWKAPLDLPENAVVELRLTIVEEKTRFWVDCNTVRLGSLAANPVSSTSTTFPTTSSSTSSSTTTAAPGTTRRSRTTRAPSPPTSSTSSSTSSSSSSSSSTTTAAPTTRRPRTTTRRPNTQPPTTTRRPNTQPPRTTRRPNTQPPTTTRRPNTRPATTMRQPATRAPTTTRRPTTRLPTTTRRPNTRSPTTMRQPATRSPTTTRRPNTRPATTMRQPATRRPTTTRRPNTRPATTMRQPATRRPTTTRRPNTRPATTMRQPATRRPTTTRRPNTHPAPAPSHGNRRPSSPPSNMGNSDSYLNYNNKASLKHETQSDIACMEYGNVYQIVPNTECRQFTQSVFGGRESTNPIKCPGSTRFDPRVCSCAFTYHCIDQ